MSSQMKASQMTLHTRRRNSHLSVPVQARARLCGYARNVLNGVHAAGPQASIVARWAAQNARRLNLDLPADFVAVWSDADDDGSPNRRAIQLMTKALDAVPMPTRAQRPYAGLARMLGMDDLEEAILTLTADYRNIASVEMFWDALANKEGEAINLTIGSSIFPLMLGATAQRVQRRMRPDAPLRSAGLLVAKHGGMLDVLSRLQPFVSEPSPPRDLRRALLGPAVEAPLAFSAFEHLGEATRHALDILRGALREKAAGMHVLLYGPPGTGKTAFAAALAAELGAPIYNVGQEGTEGEELARHERLAELRLSQRLLGGGEPALLLLDEAEDLFDAGPTLFAPTARAGSRAYVHRLIETGPLPVIWTANDISSLGPAVLRRMSCCIEVRIPPAPVRERLWREAADAEGVALPEGEARTLSQLLPSSPALASSAMRAARLAGGDPAMVRWAVTGVVRAMAGGRLPPPNGTGEAFDPQLVNADADLAELAGHLAAPGATRHVSLLLSGPPGSGKSAYARHLAERMGLPVLQKRCSDLVSPYVGETEQKIARAFEEARDAEAFLIFDEADSLLRDRALSHRSWEVSEVNEMLTWMERHPLPFCCTTNLMELIDPAAMRRFLMKARFDYLTPSQVARAWLGAFGHAAPPGLTMLDRLTPADFELVRRGAALQGHLQSPMALLEALEREQRAKPGARGAVGFR